MLRARAVDGLAAHADTRHPKEAMQETRAYAAFEAAAPLIATNIARREAGPRDVEIDILFCGICHSDLHMVRNEWGGGTRYPIVPGHEIVGRVRRVGAAVTEHRVGDLVGVGCMVDADRSCPDCVEGLEQFCPNQVLTYNAHDARSGGVTYGGYSERIVVDAHFVLRVPENLSPAAAAPLLCAGITTWSPLRRGGAGPGKKVGVVGLGGLGHMGVKLARALGAEVVVFTTSARKRDDALRLGAHDVVLSTDRDAMRRQHKSFDLIVDTVSAQHDVDAYLNLLRRDGQMTLVGAPPEPLSVAAFSLLLGRRSLSGSTIGGIAETQEMLDFCGAHGLGAEVEVIAIQAVNEAYTRLAAAQVDYRFAIDLASLRDG